MYINEIIGNDLKRLFRLIAEEKQDDSVYEEICVHLDISRLSYELDFGEDNEVKRPSRGNTEYGDKMRDDLIILYDDKRTKGLKLDYAYYYDGRKHVKAYLEFPYGMPRSDVDLELMQFLSDVICVLISRRTMRTLLERAQTTDVQTGIPNLVHINRKYNQTIARVPASDIIFIRMNLKNFKFINEAAGARAGDEAIVQYANKLLNMVNEDEGVCRLGGDNFVVFIRKENYEIFKEKVKCVLISNLITSPGQTFSISAWMGVSILEPGQDKSFSERLNESSIACDMAKGRFRKSLVEFDDSLVDMVNQGREIISIFRPAIRKHEFHPFFQPKVDMKTGKLVGFEALCRWIHEGRFIYPDQFIPILDKNAMIPALDIAIFRETCASIRQWKNMGMNPPLISSNFSKKNLFVPRIEESILEVVDEYGLQPEELEIEITESVREVEYTPLMEFVKDLKKTGIHISIDDFGTGYSSLSLIHNIDADVIKIDRSFVELLPDDEKSKILIESIINIANRLGMSVVAEGVETEEQGRALMELGCDTAQGYFFGKPVDFDTASKLLENPQFKTI